MRRRTAAALTALTGLVGPAGAFAAEPAPATPIEHFVVLMQENHSFDNYFGTFPGADGIPPGTCMPIRSSRPGRGCVRPFRLGDRAGPDLPHDAGTHRLQLAGGEMDGFVRGVSEGRQRPELAVMGHYDGRDLPFYWNVAEEYVLFDRWFAASPGGSVPNRLVLGDRHAESGRPRSSTGSSSEASPGSSTWRTTTRVAASAPTDVPTRAPRRCGCRSSTSPLRAKSAAARAHRRPRRVLRRPAERHVARRSRTSPRPEGASIRRGGRSPGRRSSERC